MNHAIPSSHARTLVLLLITLSVLAPGAMGQPNVQGQWSTLPYLMPINPVHVALLHNGKVLIVAGSGNCPPSQSGCPLGAPYGPANGSGAALWDPATGTITQFTLNWDMFCNGMVVLPDGRVFINGGTIQYDPFHGELRSSLFDPSTNIFTDIESMAHGRWYPTVTTLGDGRVMTFSGLDETGSTNTAVEIYTVGSGWGQQYSAGWTPPLYPRMHVLPNGKVFYSGSGTSSALFDPSTTSWTLNVATTKYGGTRTYGTSVLLPLTPANNYDPKVMIMGGGNPSTATTEIIDLGAPTPSWQFGPSMSQPRIEMNATILPNGRVLAMGGSLNDEDTSTKSLNADLYDPATNTFSSGGANAYARLYHSVALLLPDATVWLAGGNPTRGSYEQHMEIYKPPYLFNPDGTPAVRPTITSAPSSIGYGNAFTVQTPDAATISSAVLVRPGSPTHAFDQDQRLVGMSFTAGSGALTLTAPPNGNIAPPGYYMLFLLNSSGVPSVAQMVLLGQQSDPDTQPPTAPTNLTATAVSGSQINLSWTASTDNVGVTGYLVERCQGTGCSNFAQIGTSAGTTYNDTGLTANTSYSYRVRATDAAGNLSPYSNVASATTTSQSATIGYVQGNYAVPQTPQATVAVKFNAAQAAGDLNVVVVGWNDSAATVSGVTDSSGNAYVRAVGPTIVTGTLSQSIYYAKNILAAAGGANTVTVQFSTAALYPDIRILEYSGADLGSPVDVTAAATGSGGTSNSGSATTTNATDLIFGANVVTGGTAGPGSGFTQRLLTSPDSDIAEDRMVSTTGSYSATAPASGQWIMQMVAFRTPAGGGGGDTQPPTAPTNLTATAAGGSQINLSWTASTDNVGVTGYLVERCQGTGCSNFAQIGTSAGTTYNDTGLTSGTSYSYRVRATDAAGNLSPYSNVASAVTGTLVVTPRVAALTFTRTQQFTASSGSVTWSVDGVVGGSGSSGTITSTGLYSPPTSAGTHTVTATTTDLLQSASATVYITNYPGTFTHHNDNFRTGQNTNETVLTPSNVNQSQFGKLFSYTMDGIAFASPLYVANVNISGQGFHNVVYVATEHDSVYAWDADGLSASPLWKVSFLGSGVTSVPCADTGECGDIPNEIGITGTPVIDQASGTLYLVSKTKKGGNYTQSLHALDIATGAEKFGGPVVIQASVPGSGEGSQGGQLSFDALRENQRPALVLSNGVLYIGWASHGDQHPWHGWVMAYNPATLQQMMAYCDSPDGYGGGIWASGGGLGADSSGNIYFNTGNGDFTANTGGKDYGDSVVKLSPSGTVSDYFTPYDQANMESQDLDLSSAGPVLLLDQSGPNPHLLITAAKTGTIYVVNRDNMGHFNSGNDNQIVQSLVGILPHGGLEEGNFSAPAFFNGYVYFAAVNDTLKAFQLTNGLLSNGPTSQSLDVYPNRGGAFAVSGNGNTNGIIWAMQDNNPANGVLHAYDTGNLASELYNTNQAGTRDAPGVASKFAIPLVANGKVFVAAQTQLVGYGLLP